jgi:hypothetical protein
MLQRQTSVDHHAQRGITGKAEANQPAGSARRPTPKPAGLAAISAQNASYAGSLCTRMTSQGISISPAGEGTTR